MGGENKVTVCGYRVSTWDEPVLELDGSVIGQCDGVINATELYT